MKATIIVFKCEGSDETVAAGMRTFLEMVQTRFGDESTVVVNNLTPSEPKQAPAPEVAKESAG